MRYQRLPTSHGAKGRLGLAGIENTLAAFPCNRDSKRSENAQASWVGLKGRVVRSERICHRGMDLPTR